jgi:hypothetical protein
MSTGEQRGRFLPLDVSPEWREKKALERGEVVLSPLGTATIYPSQVPYWRNPFEADPPRAGGKAVLDFSQAEVARARNELALMLAGQPPEDVDWLRLAGLALVPWYHRPEQWHEWMVDTAVFEAEWLPYPGWAEERDTPMTFWLPFWWGKPTDHWHRLKGQPASDFCWDETAPAIMRDHPPEESDKWT